MRYTGYYAKIKEYESNGVVVVAISGKIPDGFNGIKYQKIAPKYIWWQKWHDEKMSDEWYIDKYYETVLNQLNPNEVLNDLQKMGENIVLLCYETPEKFCHRQLVADWLNKNTNANIIEYEFTEKQPEFSF